MVVMCSFVSDFFIVFCCWFVEHYVFVSWVLGCRIYLELLRSFRILIVKVISG